MTSSSSLFATTIVVTSTNCRVSVSAGRCQTEYCWHSARCRKEALSRTRLPAHNQPRCNKWVGSSRPPWHQYVECVHRDTLACSWSTNFCKNTLSLTFSASKMRLAFCYPSNVAASLRSLCPHCTLQSCTTFHRITPPTVVSLSPSTRCFLGPLSKMQEYLKISNCETGFVQVFSLPVT